LDYELRMQGLEGAASTYKYVGGLELHHAAMRGHWRLLGFLLRKNTTAQCTAIRMVLLLFMHQFLEEA